MSKAKKKTTKKPATQHVKANPMATAPHKPIRPGLGKGLGALINHSHPHHQHASPPPPAPLQSGTAHQQCSPAPQPYLGSPVAALETVPGQDSRMVFDLPVAEIARSPWQPRQTFEEEALRELAESIKANGVIQPLICRKNLTGRYELIAGERRLRAAIAAGLSKIPVILIDAEDRHAAELAIIENIQRQDLTIIEEAEGYRTLAETFNLTQQEVADRVGKARASIANAVRLLDLPDEVKQLVGSGLLSTGHAKVLLGLENSTEQTLLGRKCVSEDLTVRSLEKMIQRRKADAAGHGDPRRLGKPDLPESYVRDLSDRLHKHFGTAVRLTPGITHANGRHTKGVLELDFYDNSDLDRLLSLLGIAIDID